MTITKYRNRRYYIPKQGFVPLSELHRMYTAGTKFKVVCIKTKRDITAEVLFQSMMHNMTPLQMTAMFKTLEASNGK